MLENINPMLIFAVLGVVIVISLIIVLDPFGFKSRFTNAKERFDGLTSLNKKLFEQITPMATPNVADPSKYVPDIPQNSASLLNSLIFPEIKNIPSVTTPNEQPIAQSVAPPAAELVTEPAAELVTEPAAELVTEPAAEPVTSVETASSFQLPEMVAKVEETQPAILPSPTLPEQQNIQQAETEVKPFELPQIIATEPAVQEKPIELPSALTDLELPPTTQSTFNLPELVDTNVQTNVPENQSSIITSLEEQNKPVDVQAIVSNTPSENTPANAADLIKQQIEQPTIQSNGETTVTTTSIINGTGIVNINENVNSDNAVAGGELVNNGIMNQFTNTRIIGAYPLYR